MGGDTKFRALAARLNYLALDRPDLQYCSKNISKYISSPTPTAWRMLKRVGRYLVGAMRVVQLFEWQHRCSVLKGMGDSDWAGDRVTGKSTRGGCLMLGRHLLKSWSSNQQTVAMSSGEAELYALTRSATQVVGMLQLLQDFNVGCAGVVCTGSTAAIGISLRRGLGRTRHIKVQYLWIQERLEDGDLRIEKVHTEANHADLMTKHLRKEDRERHMKGMNIRVEAGRSSASLSIEAVSRGADEWLVKGRVVGEEVKFDNFSAKVDEDLAEKIVQEMKQECSWVRLHNRIRRALFTPMKIARGPSRVNEVGSVRVSLLQMTSGEITLYVDRWKTEQFPHRRVGTCTGWTGFLSKVPVCLNHLRLNMSPAEGG